MWLLSVNIDGGFSLTGFTGNNIPRYAILSHTWEADDQELTFQDITTRSGRSKAGYRKIQFCRDQAKKDGLQYFWVDSCCINKSSSAELSEAINSMFRWYQNAVKCYVFLSDVSTGKHSRSSELIWEPALRQSRWFTRGWTLQELIAPRSVQFFSRDGRQLGDKDSLKQQIHEITGIAAPVLQGLPLSQFSVEERMSWQSKRETTIEEDQAYCLMGIFEIYLPVIYGEGVENAFKRLREAIDKDSTELKCLQALRTSDYEEFKDRNPDRLDGTCKWFLQHKTYQEWQQNSSTGLLWVSADPGCGKSVLSKSLVNQELRANESRATCFFFFKDDNDKQKSVSTALSALLHQLFRQRRFLIKHALDDYKVEGEKLFQSFHKLWGILTKAASDPKAGQVICVLDALDECAESGRYQLIDAFNTFYQQSGSANKPQLRFIVTSRPYLDIERRFTVLISSFPTIRLQGEHESDIISGEIDIVIRWRVSQLQSELKLNNSETSNLEIELLRIANRTYLWLTLIFEIIRKTIRPTSRKLKAVISTLPSTVDKAYEAILSKIEKDERPQARKLLHIIVAATRPLTLGEMNIALAIEDNHKCYDDLDLDDEVRFEASVRNLCGLFVTVVDQKVYLIHQTAREFLIARSEVATSGWKHSLKPTESETLIAKTCITYLAFTEFDGAMDRTSTAVEYGYFDYAAGSWAAHYRKAQDSKIKQMLQLVLKVCDTQSQRFITWFDVYWRMAHRYWEPNPQFTSILMVGSYFGHEDVVKLLLATGQVGVNSKDKYGQMPLLWAARNGHEAVARLLLATDQVDVNSKDKNYGQTPLSFAARNGHEAIVKLLLATGQVDVNSKDEYSQTPLLLAALNGHEAIVKLLLATGQVDVNSKDNKYGQTPLLRAAENGHEAIVKLLLATGQVDVNSKDEYSWTPLLLAAENGHEAIVKLLLATGQVDVNSKDEYSQTPLLLVALNGHEAIVKLLLATDQVDVNSKNEYSQTPLLLAAENGHEAIVKLLLATGQVDVNSKNKYGQVPLLWAARNGHEAVVKLLLATGQVDVNSKNKYGETPLLLAALNGHEAVARLLLATGQVDVNSKDNNYGRTPLSLAALNGHEAVARLLLATGQVDVNSKNKYRETPLLLAALNGHEAVARLLLATGQVDVNSKDNNYGRTPLSLAALNGHEAVVELLLATGQVDVVLRNSTLTPASV
jgi:ankyrin repeat protein